MEKKGQLGYTKANDQDFDILIMQMVSVQSLLRHQPLATRNAKMGLYYIYPFKSFLACTIKRASLLEYYSVRSFPLILHKMLYFTGINLDMQIKELERSVTMRKSI